MKDYRTAAREVSEAAAMLNQGVPEAMKGFAGLGKGAYSDGALSRKTKELFALALSVAARCDGCVAYHAKRAHDLGASRDEVLEVLAVNIQMGGGPAMVYAGEALRAFDTFNAAQAAE